MIPNPVNCLVVGKQLFMPDPGFAAFRRGIAAALVPLGLTVHFMDIWEPYHTASGEVHCGTNALRHR